MADQRPAGLEVEQGPDALKLVLSGDWRHSGVGEVQAEMARLATSEKANHIIVDISGASHFDTAGAWLVRRLQLSTEQRGASFEVKGPKPSIELIAGLPDVTEAAKRAVEPRKALFYTIFEPIGLTMYGLWDDLIASAFILGSAVRGAQMKLGRGSGVSPASVVSQLDHMGVRAVPIIVLMSFLIGAIIAQQGAFQLRYFGAEVFVVDLVGILQLREIGVLLTAIMIAGRSGSAITAEIGSMKMREEVDALKVMGLNPIGVLVFPRLLALVVALPLLTIIANFAALFGAAVVALAYSGITFDVFLGRLREAIDISTIASGMIKAPFMALIIGIVAAVEGLKVGGSAESLGRRVTSSVVKSIFVVILVDGLFAMFYAAIDF
ncbi:MAG: organic solvent ABC transporter permease [Rhizobiales bacterium]|nr:organic solvent ABC transporter permease [Hyphomicrobiales bacterium]